MIKIFATAVEGFLRWIDGVAGFVVPLLDRATTRRLVKLTETDTDEFLVESSDPSSKPALVPQSIRIQDGQAEQNSLLEILPGSRVELVLQSKRFLFRQMELPDRAGEFLEGIVRAQIDRLTPWNAADAAYGWSQPAGISADRMSITIAASAAALVRPYVKAIMSLGAQTVAVMTSPPEANAGAAPITVWEDRARETVELHRIRRALVFTLAAASIVTGVAIGLSSVVGAYLDAQHLELSRQITGARTQIQARQAADSGSTASARQRLGQRKNDIPATVVILDALSQILPDHTYVTELRIEGPKLRVIGITRDAPSLIGLIEQSRRFSRATFFAPTTRSPTDPGERFHIETVIQSSAGAPS